MNRRWLLSLLIIVSPTAFAVDVRICTNRGAIDVELDELRAPLHTANFLRYADSGFYGGTIFHRAVRNGMVQGGSYTADLERRPGNDPVANESSNGLSNRRGTIAAARGEDPNSASSQFFFNLGDNTHLDAGAGSPGYTVFGRVTAGIEVLDAIGAMQTRRVGELAELPSPTVEIESVVRLDRATAFGLSIEPDPATLQRNFQDASGRGDPAAILAAADALKASCITLDPDQRVAEADAARALGLVDRARYGMEQYLATASLRDTEYARAQELYAALALPGRERPIEELIGNCRRPVAPDIPDPRFSQLQMFTAAEVGISRYRQLGEQYLACLERRLGSDDLTPAEILSLTDHHNDVVVEMTGVAVAFNRAVREFKSLDERDAAPFTPLRRQN